MRYTLVPDARLAGMVDALAPAARAAAEKAGAYALSVLVRRHVNAYARRHHDTASALGASPTRHLEDGSAAIVADGSSVDIPIPGISRAFHALEVRPRTKKCLTIPVNRIAYGVRAGRLASEGWDLFTVRTRGGGPGAGILFGRKDGEGAATALYLLRTRARVPQDRTMLPSDEDMQRTTAKAVSRAIMRRTA